MPATPLWLAAAEAALNRNIAFSAIAATLVARLEGRSMQIDAISLARVRATVAAGRLLLIPGDDSPADAVITGTPPALLRLFTAASSSPSARDNARISGDAEVAHQFRELLQRIRPDFEAELSRGVGAMPAHGMAKAVAAFLSWGGRAADTTRANIREYLQEESGALVNPTELDEYLRGVDGVREAVDRAEARLEAIERRSSRSA